MSTKPKRALTRSAQKPPRKAGAVRGLLGKIVQDIGLRIVDGTYAPGVALPTEPDLMVELDVSRTVLREAIKILAGKGLVESRTRSGTQVLPRGEWNLLDPTILRLYCQVVEYGSFAHSFQQIRVIIEPEAAALAARHRSREQLAAIEAAYCAMEAADDAKSWTPADLGFHETILDATGNPFMRPLGALISAALGTLISHSFEVSSDPFKSLPAHRQVLDSIRKRDERQAREHMKALLAGTALSISKTVKAERGRNPTEPRNSAVRYTTRSP
jgi:DNA-binding FadR family transcriptional regulator